ncbi:MAG: hypothetical protein K9J37_03070 [Saprospiraceae bacterium]|nr:hypothetical protein [Saprospiraceae bacterium]MCF8248863.1 hypothetical protein [Saprospiraceae bacterium]MCF8279588.1 hypothetical protein [Bacteroidales bacterium]MCF8310148.1 hypothetical protein [Saprospiraceae bacterium]MCF8439048.1 hypothetical protein [Saprospiraceae bacterium]
MKKILWIFSSALLLSAAIFTTGCGDDTTVDDLSPIVSISAGPTPSTVVEGAGTIVYVTVSATKGTKALQSLSFFEGATNIPLDDITVDGITPASDVHAILSPTDAMTFEIGIKVNAAAGTATYTISVKDEGGLSDEAPFEVIVTAPETPLSMTLVGATINLWNQAGPVGFGGIDLDNGNSTGSSDALAELRDMGIDSLAGSGDNWRRRIGGVGGTSVRFAGNGSVEFGNVASKEAIVSIYDNASDLLPASTYTSGNIDVWGNFKVSDTVNEGDAFVVYKSSNNTYYLVVVNTITETTTLADNTDKYNVSIKY